MKTLRPLRMRLLDSKTDPFLDPLAGEIVTVTKASHYLSDGFMIKFRDGVKPRLFDEVEEFKVWASNLEILEEDLPLVPERTRNVSQKMSSLWILGQGRNDAYCEVPKTEKDLDDYYEKYGVEWEDDRVFDVGRTGR
jgi:hypothetical protein